MLKSEDSLINKNVNYGIFEKKGHLIKELGTVYIFVCLQVLSIRAHM